MKDKIKSKLQKELESQGWIFLANEDVKVSLYYHNDDEFILEHDLIQKTDGKLKEEYMERGFSEVRIADAYDIHGNYISCMRAIYVK
ncbi:MAG: hypothetical protein OQK82_08390 [Candidatus Pacearchaeota archaeon]|nr:hypothetical protein [Candidatus Pacearchaeota archaeon]